jgi:hypothetical protein
MILFLLSNNGTLFSTLIYFRWSHFICSSNKKCLRIYGNHVCIYLFSLAYPSQDPTVCASFSTLYARPFSLPNLLQYFALRHDYKVAMLCYAIRYVIFILFCKILVTWKGWNNLYEHIECWMSKIDTWVMLHCSFPTSIQIITLNKKNSSIKSTNRSNLDFLLSLFGIWKIRKIKILLDLEFILFSLLHTIRIWIGGHVFTLT